MWGSISQGDRDLHGTSLLVIVEEREAREGEEGRNEVPNLEFLLEKHHGEENRHHGTRGYHD